MNELTVEFLNELDQRTFTDSWIPMTKLPEWWADQVRNLTNELRRLRYKESDNKARVGGVWLVYYTDWSGWRIFEAEIDALRYAVEHHMEVVLLPFGSDPRSVTD